MKFILIFLLLSSSLFAYETVKATNIVNNPSNYNGKDVLVYVKFGGIASEDRTNKEGFFNDFNVSGIKYRYDLTNSEAFKLIKQLKSRDLVTVKGTVILDGFDPVVSISSIVNGWMDTTLLPPTPSVVTVTCPKCGNVFKYKIGKNDYKNSILSDRDTDDITPVSQSNGESKIDISKKMIENKKKIDENRPIFKEEQVKEEKPKEQKKDETWTF